MIDLTPIFQALIALMAALITCKLIPWVKSKTTKQQYENILTVAKVAVYAAEQIFGAGQGYEKMEYTLDVLKKAGFNIDATIAREAIEKAVMEMNHGIFDKDPDDTDAGDEKENAVKHPFEDTDKPVILDGICAEENEIPAQPDNGQPVTQGGVKEPPDGGEEADE